MLISVIIPVYNVESYLHQCIDSVLAQTYQDFELLLIDDGSTDGSGAICDAYAAKDARVQVFHKENGGVSSARNIGINNSTGEWITFVDSDDWIAKECLNILIGKELQQTDSDFVVASYLDVKVIKEEEKSFKFSEILSQKKFVEKYPILPLYSTPFAKLFKRSIIVDNNINFDITLNFAEDTIFILSYLKYCRKIETRMQIIYFHREVLNSLTYKKQFIYSEDVNLLNIVTSHLNLIDIDNKIVEKRKVYYIARVLNAIYKDNSLNYKTKKKYLKELIQTNYLGFIEIYKNSRIFGVLATLLIKTKQFRILNIVYLVLYSL